jgi:hypothetical protein
MLRVLAQRCLELAPGDDQHPVNPLVVGPDPALGYRVRPWRTDRHADDFRTLDLMRNGERAGQFRGCSLVVEDLEAARADLAARGVEIGESFQFGAEDQAPGLDPARRNYASFASFSEPDRNGWLVQEVKPSF